MQRASACVGGDFTAALSPAICMHDLQWPRPEQIVIQADNHIALIKVIVRSNHTSKGAASLLHPGAPSRLARSGTSASSDIALRDRQAAGPASAMSLRRLKSASHRLRARASALACLPTHAANTFQVDGTPSSNGSFRAFGIIETENRGLHEGVARAARHRMIRIAVKLGRTAGIGRGDDGLGVAIKQDASRIIARHAWAMSSGWLT